MARIYDWFYKKWEWFAWRINWTELKPILRDITIFMVAMFIFGAALLLSGCARHTETMPEQTIVSSGVTAANETLDWAKNNLADTSENRVLMGQIVSCRDSLSACGDACAAAREKYSAELSAAHAKTNMWRVIAAALVATLVIIGVLKLKK